MSKLHLAEHLSLPLDVVTQTVAILAKRRAGKSYTMRRLAEQLFKAHQQIVIVDPKGDQWGIRSASDGKGAGLPVTILGGEHGDVPLEPTSGEIVAKLVVEARVCLVLDLSPFRKSEVAKFMTDFLENLYRLKARECYRTPMMLVIDEADAIAPQKPQHGEERMLGAAEDIVRRGGQRGIGCILVTQRSAVLNKNVLTQAQMLVALRTIAPQDLAAMKAWIDVHGTPEECKTLMDSLPSLPIGDAWFWSPGWPTTDGIFTRVHVLPIETFDSGATPKPGVKVIEPKQVADVDLEALKRQMAATIEKAKAEDPKQLRAKIQQLEAELRKIKTAPGPKVEPTIKEVPVLKGKQLAQLDSFCTKLMREAERHGSAMSLFWSNLNQVAESLLKAIKSTVQEPPARPTRQDVSRRITTFEVQKFPSVRKQAHEAQTPVNRDPDFRAASTAERKLLTVLAQYPNGKTTVPLAHLAGYTVNGHFKNMLGALRSHGYVTKGQPIQITDDGRTALGPFDPLPTGDELRAYWLRKISSSESRILQVLIHCYPDGIATADLARESGYTVNGHFKNMLGHLRSIQLAEGRGDVRASATLFE